MSAEKTTRDRSNSASSSNAESVDQNANDEKYVVLCETSGREFESWYYFIRYGGNQKALEYLQKQLEKIDMYVLDDFSTFDLDLDHFFLESTAKEMTKETIMSVSAKVTAAFSQKIKVAPNRVNRAHGPTKENR